jgi:hypothetical protein
MPVLLAACATSGVKVTNEQAQSFKIGKSTYADVVAVLGPPTSLTSSSGGGRMAIYVYAQTSVRPATFIPYIGPFVGGADSKSSGVAFAFDQHGVLANVSSEQSGVGIGLGLAKGGRPE